MACTRPLVGYRDGKGRIRIEGEMLSQNPPKMRIACGRCSQCRMSISREWAIRCMHEMQEPSPVAHGKHKGETVYVDLVPGRGCMLTLTYRNEDLPDDLSVDKRHFQKFVKRCRKAGLVFRYLHCGEYGEVPAAHGLGRPHYHAAIFGEDFSFDRYLFKKSAKGFDLYRSPLLEKLWPFGHSTISELTYESAQYVARYVLKKQFGHKAENLYGKAGVQPPYATMSRKPGLGNAWFKKYFRSVYPRDSVILDGKEIQPPRYYDTLLSKTCPHTYEFVKRERLKSSLENEPRCLDQLKLKDRMTEYMLDQASEKRSVG